MIAGIRCINLQGGHQKMVQDIYPHKLHNEFDPNVQATQEDVLLCIVNGKILIHLNRIASISKELALLFVVLF